MKPSRRPYGRHETGSTGRIASSPIRFGPNVFLVQTQPGFEGIAWEEVASRYADRSGAVNDGAATVGTGAAEPDEQRGAKSASLLARRVVPGRSGITIFSAPRPDPLARLRTAEDVFSVVAYRYGIDDASAGLDRVLTTARSAPYVDEALDARVRMLPGTRSGRHLSFRVIARLVGEHEFHRSDFKRAIERGICERQGRRWRVEEDRSDVEFWATMIEGELILAIRLSDERMRHREYKVAHMPGSLRPSVAATLAWLSEPGSDDVVLDPMCGAGTVLIERAHLGRYKLLIGSDRNTEALEAARENIGPRYKPIETHSWDAVALPLPDHSVTKIITNLPWGIRHGSHPENRRMYPRYIAEFKRVIAHGGLIVMLTAESALMNDLIRRSVIRPERIIRASILGARASVYVCRAD